MSSATGYTPKHTCTHTYILGLFFPPSLHVLAYPSKSSLKKEPFNHFIYVVRGDYLILMLYHASMILDSPWVM